MERPQVFFQPWKGQTSAVMLSKGKGVRRLTSSDQHCNKCLISLWQQQRRPKCCKSLRCTEDAEAKTTEDAALHAIMPLQDAPGQESTCKDVACVMFPSILAAKRNG